MDPVLLGMGCQRFVKGLFLMLVFVDRCRFCTAFDC